MKNDTGFFICLFLKCLLNLLQYCFCFVLFLATRHVGP